MLSSDFAPSPKTSQFTYSHLRSREAREFLLLLLGVVGVLFIGTLGFTIIEGWPPFDSLYMTVTTLATIGYQEVHPLSTAGRVFNMVLIVLGVGLATIALSTITQSIIKRQFVWIFERRRVREIISKLQDHTIICGYGRLTRIAANELRLANVQVVIVDKEESRAQEAEQNGFLVVRGDAAFDETLLEAGIKRARRLAALLPKDADNLYIILTSRELSPSIFILSRAEDDLGEKRLRRAGADRIIAPYRVGGHKIADGILRPHVTDFIDLAVTSSKGDLQIEEIVIPEKSALGGLTLQDSALRQKANVIIAAIISKSGEMQFNPLGTTVIEPGATLIGLGYKKDLATLEKLLVA